ncbi:DUF2284 domain-containing protein [Methanosarcina barkeri]|uniref:Metal-binding protein n=1 Tax=Methanosarcina barkeri 227 TaxID=1434106 RepID=A0A0E3R2V6_METBA|nr:DUF2284 domain-containing protein [Methanosarcina barkeri]AKB57754.1 hypothetical protein MSBR2_1238 [Methanosarcina barkeri 227]
MSSTDIKPEEFDFLVKKALELEAIDAKIIPTYNVFVEKRVVLKCRGCIGYGKKLTCPPHVPTVDEVREILKEYSYAMLVKFRSPASQMKKLPKHHTKPGLTQQNPRKQGKKPQSSGKNILTTARKRLPQCWSSKR